MRSSDSMNINSFPVGGGGFSGVTNVTMWKQFYIRHQKLIAIIVMVWATLATYFAFIKSPTNCPWKWHGGSPMFNKGSCWCGEDGYCMCTPSLAIDGIIEVKNPSNPEDVSIVLVHRRDPPKDVYAIPGGFVDVGETVEHATIRELKEETNLDIISLEQFRVYSDPKRDKRRHTVSAVFRATAVDVSKLHKGDDAKSVKIVPLKEVPSLTLAFDHRTILMDYIEKYYPNLLK
jgi:8-oxo-dGTP diphosphatase